MWIEGSRCGVCVDVYRSVGFSSLVLGTFSFTESFVFRMFIAYSIQEIKLKKQKISIASFVLSVEDSGYVCRDIYRLLIMHLGIKKRVNRDKSLICM